MNQNEFSKVTQRYLERYRHITENMIYNMGNAKLNCSISHNFIVQMIPHHMAAVEMCENLLKYTTYIPLQNMAEDIICEQSEGIREMKEICAKCSSLTDSRQDICCYYGKYKSITERMFTGMRTAPEDNDINLNFIREMIPHHEGAVEMSENALRFRICRELVPILNSIIKTQKQGIAELREMYKDLSET